MRRSMCSRTTIWPICVWSSWVRRWRIVGWWKAGWNPARSSWSRGRRSSIPAQASCPNPWPLPRLANKGRSMAQFFIGRPILAWVIAIFISIAGILSLPSLPVSQYPQVAPPQLTVRAFYTGASPEEMYEGVAQPIEEELNGIEGLRYFESTSDSSGVITITATFTTSVDIGQATVDVQNAVRRVERRLPNSVVQQGITVQRAGTGFLMMVALTSTDGSRNAVDLGDYLTRNILGELRRIDGVGNAQLFAAARAMRIWIDPDKLTGLNLTSADVTAAIGAQNAQVAAGQIGADPNPINQQLTATVLVKGQLSSLEEFQNIVLRANPDGSTVRLGDV